jgi:hypothetical protein
MCACNPRMTFPQLSVRSLVWPSAISRSGPRQTANPAQTNQEQSPAVAKVPYRFQSRCTHTRRPGTVSSFLGAVTGPGITPKGVSYLGHGPQPYPTLSTLQKRFDSGGRAPRCGDRAQSEHDSSLRYNALCVRQSLTPVQMFSAMRMYGFPSQTSPESVPLNPGFGNQDFDGEIFFTNTTHRQLPCFS